MIMQIRPVKPDLHESPLILKLLGAEGLQGFLSTVAEVAKVALGSDELVHVTHWRKRWVAPIAPREKRFLLKHYWAALHVGGACIFEKPSHLVRKPLREIATNRWTPLPEAKGVEMPSWSYGVAMGCPKTLKEVFDPRKYVTIELKLSNGKIRSVIFDKENDDAGQAK